MSTLFPADACATPIHIKSADELEDEYLMRMALAYLITYQQDVQSGKLEALIARIAVKAG